MIFPKKKENFFLHIYIYKGLLHAYFASNGYYFVTGLYGNKFNGYMGVGIAVPLKLYDIIHVDITRIADTKIMPKEKVKLGYVQKVIANTKKWLINFMISLGIQIFKPMNKIDEFWDNTLYRTNQMISMKLKDKRSQGDKCFVVSTYHMPCMFQLPSGII